jgi:hypothetical protein
VLEHAPLHIADRDLLPPAGAGQATASTGGDEPAGQLAPQGKQGHRTAAPSTLDLPPLFRAKRQGRNRICLPVSSQMVTKTSHYTQTQLEKLANLAKETGKTGRSKKRDDRLFRTDEKNILKALPYC